MSQSETFFLWGPRQTGKSTLLKIRFPGSKRYDLLLASEYRRLLQNPGVIREEILADKSAHRKPANPIIIDEIQKIPELLDEVHWLIENIGARFILCGSSARKVRRGRANLLGGRAIRYELYPLVYPEIPDFNLIKALNSGLIPRHYMSPSPRRLLEAYVGDYLKEEIVAEALTRNIPAFNRFLEIAAFSNGELVNYRNVASESGISAPTAKEYFQILEDTLIGKMVPAFRKKAKRRQIGAPKFFFFDVGVVAHLAHRGKIEPGSELFGKAFEQFIFMELRAHSSYSEMNYSISYWRTASGFETDFILNDHEIAIEVKSASSIRNRHLKGIRAFKEEFSAKHFIVVSMEAQPRRTADGIDILPWHIFLERLWKGQIVN